MMAKDAGRRSRPAITEKGITTLGNSELFATRSCQSEPHRSASEERERNCLGHRAVTCGRRMQMIARIIRQLQALRMAGVSHDFIEVHHGVEMPRSANPLIDSLPISLVAQPRLIIV